MTPAEELLAAAKRAQAAIHEHWCLDGDCDECVALCEAIARTEKSA